jgi:hypothetical protein
LQRLVRRPIRWLVILSWQEDEGSNLKRVWQRRVAETAALGAESLADAERAAAGLKDACA